MANIDDIKRLIEEETQQQFGTKEERIAAFRQRMEDTLTQKVIETFDIEFGWDDKTDGPIGTIDLETLDGWIHPGKDGHIGSLNLMSKRRASFQNGRPFDNKIEFLQLFKGWLGK